jgi:Uncharacterized protein conserved in bacteria
MMQIANIKPNLTTLLQSLESPGARDLAWLLFSPTLLQSPLGRHKALPVLTQFAQNNPSEIVTWLQTINASKHTCTPPPIRGFPNKRLGKYFEEVIETILSSNAFYAYSGIKCVMRNYQYIENKVTKGELDYLLQYQDGSVVHVEAAIKFYLLNKQSSDPKNWHQWLGPNSRDTLGLKLTHMQDKQLTLLDNPKARSEVLEVLHLPQSTPVTTAYLLKGMLFVHWLEQPCLPKHINTEVTTGVWLHESQQFEFLNAYKKRGFVSTHLEKAAWMGGHYWAETSNPENEVEAYYKAGGAAPYMLSVVNPVSQEEIRAVVVDDYWPVTNSPSRKI